MQLSRLLLILLATSVVPGYAQTWSAVGPPGGDVRALAADPRNHRTVYLGTAKGVLYRSDDAGLTWRRLEPGFPQPGMSLDEIIVDPRGHVIIGFWSVAGAGGGVARSTDGGHSFELLPEIAGESVRGLAIAANDPDTLVAGASSGVFRSRDGGRSWRRISPEGDANLRNVGSVAIDPGDPDVVYAGTWHLPWRTRDGGATWKRISKGMITDSDIMTLSLDPRAATTLHATACTGIYRSTNGGERWTRLQGIPWSARRTRGFARDPAAPDTLHAGTTQGLWISENGGGRWRLATQPQLVVNALLALPGGTLLAGCDGAGVLRSDDGGRSWLSANTGFFERFVSHVSFESGTRRVLVGVLGDRNHSGVLTAASPTGPWAATGTGLEGRKVLSLAPEASKTLAGTDDGIFVLDRAARTWRRLPTVVNGLDVHPRATSLATIGEHVILGATSRGLLRSVDSGASWQRQTLGSATAVSALAVSLQASPMVLAATALGIYVSADSGATWQPRAASLGRLTVHELAFLPGSDRILFAATNRGLLKSTDQGRSWSPRVELPLAAITGLALHPNGRTLYATDFSFDGLYRSEDGGESWEPFPLTGLASRRVWTVAVEPVSPHRLLASAPEGGLFVSSGSTKAAAATSAAPAAAGARDQR